MKFQLGFVFIIALLGVVSGDPKVETPKDETKKMGKSRSLPSLSSQKLKDKFNSVSNSLGDLNKAFNSLSKNQIKDLIDAIGKDVLKANREHSNLNIYNQGQNKYKKEFFDNLEKVKTFLQNGLAENSFFDFITTNIKELDKLIAETIKRKEGMNIPTKELLPLSYEKIIAFINNLLNDARKVFINPMNSLKIFRSLTRTDKEQNLKLIDLGDSDKEQFLRNLKDGADLAGAVFRAYAGILAMALHS